MSAQLAEIADSRDRIEQMPQDAREMLIASNLEQADAWLRAALDVPSPDPRSIADYKVQVAAIEQMARQLRVSKDLQNNATKCIRRAERGVGVAIRKGQEDGVIATLADGASKREAHRGSNNTSVLDRASKPSPDEFASKAELHGNGAGIYHMTDDVSDEQFEEALAEAESEGNLSRANVVRKIKEPGEVREQLATRIAALAAEGYTSKQIASETGKHLDWVRKLARTRGITIPADIVTSRSHNLDAERMMTGAVEYTAAVADSLKMIDPNDLDPDDLTEWVKAIEKSARSILTTTRQMKEQNHA